MRKKIVAGNWKMNTTIPQGQMLAQEIAEKINTVPSDVNLIIAPPFTHLATVAQIINKTNIGLSAQNCADNTSGAYTGEVAVNMIASANAKYVILGHSERREYYGETNEKLVKKINLVLEEGLSPIYCVGEKLAERESNNHFKVVEQQIKEVLFSLSEQQMKKVIVAYEPVWAIGTGKTASKEQAQEIHAFIRNILKEKFGALAQEISILYGGSCKPSNAKDLFAQMDIDGGLIGGASLVASDFIAIAQSF